jgi:hypothetical protein
MDIEEIRTKYNNGDYKYTVDIPAKVPLYHVFDEELSVKRNRELAEEHNATVDNIVKEKRSKQQELDTQLTNDVVEYLVNICGLSLRQARVIESFAYQEHHSYMGDYFSYIDTYADLAEELLTCEEPDIL